MLKDFSLELSIILERETSAAALLKKAELAKEKPEIGSNNQRSLESVCEEIRMNEKIIERQRLELNRLTARTNQVSNREYLHSLENEIEKTRNELNNAQRGSKYSSDNKGKVKNQSEASLGAEDSMPRVGEIEHEVYQYEKKNQALAKKNEEIQRAIEEIETKLETQKDILRRLKGELMEYNIDIVPPALSNALDEATNNVLNMEMTISSLEESKKKNIQRIKNDMEDLRFLIAHRSRLIYEKESEVAEHRVKFEQLILKESLASDLQLIKENSNYRMTSYQKNSDSLS